eukprot:jgi/Bigna1/72837/fgenesh1_pg.21_\
MWQDEEGSGLGSISAKEMESIQREHLSYMPGLSAAVASSSNDDPPPHSFTSLNSFYDTGGSSYNGTHEYRTIMSHNSSISSSSSSSRAQNNKEYGVVNGDHQDSAAQARTGTKRVKRKSPLSSQPPPRHHRPAVPDQAASSWQQLITQSSNNQGSSSSTLNDSVTGDLKIMGNLLDATNENDTRGESQQTALRPTAAQLMASTIWRCQYRYPEGKVCNRVFPRYYHCPHPGCKYETVRTIYGVYGQIREHYRRHGAKIYPCGKCGKMFALRKDVNSHSKACGVKNFFCLCGAAMATKRSRNLHIKRGNLRNPGMHRAVEMAPKEGSSIHQTTNSNSRKNTAPITSQSKRGNLDSKNRLGNNGSNANSLVNRKRSRISMS